MPKQSEYETVVRDVLKPFMDDPNAAWLGLYRLLLWYEHGVPHIMDADRLVDGIWRKRAQEVAKLLAQELNCSEVDLQSQVDLLVRSDIFDYPPQRNNVTGKGFVTAIFQLLRCFSAADYDFLPEGEIGKAVFPGVREAPRRAPDIVVSKNGMEVAVISVKWSIRHDRLKDSIDECDYYKRLRPSLKFYFVTNEFDPARLAKLMQSYCIDAVYHVHKALLDALGINGRVRNVRDLSELLTTFR